MTKPHYANPANCIDREPPVDPNWKPSQPILNLDSLGPVSEEKFDHVLHLDSFGPVTEEPIKYSGARLDSIGPSFEIKNKPLCLEGPNDEFQFTGKSEDKPWTAEDFSNAQISHGGNVIREAKGNLNAN